jgi:hypothetical protein
VKQRDAENAPPRRIIRGRQDDVKIKFKSEGKIKGRFPAPECVAGYLSAAKRVGMTSKEKSKRNILRPPRQTKDDNRFKFKFKFKDKDKGPAFGERGLQGRSKGKS